MAKQFNFEIEIDIPKNFEKKLQDAAAEAMKEVSSELNGRFMDAMKSAVWVWPRPSKRGVGGNSLSNISKKYKKASYNTNSPRSIVDSGALSDSGDFTNGYGSASWIWSVDYAAAVHDGAWIYPWGNQKAQKLLLPARPWTTAVLFGHPHYSGEIYPFSDRLAQAIEKKLR